MNLPRKECRIPTHNRLSKLPLGCVTARGWMRDQLLRSKEGMGGHLDEWEPDMIAYPFLDHRAFRQLPHHTQPDDPTFAAGWSSEISGTYWTGLIQLAFTLNDEALKTKATRWVEGVLANQEPDGYLGGYAKTTDRMADYDPWSANWCYRALLSYYEATGREEVLRAVHRGLLWFCENWAGHFTDYAGPTILESMAVVYALTGDGRLLAFCDAYMAWLETHSHQRNTLASMREDALPYASMHGVAYGEDVKHPAILYCVNGREDWLQASEKGVRKALERMVQFTGAPSTSNEGIGPVGAVQETEYCNFITYNHTYAWMAMADGRAWWGDQIERNLFNGAQGGRRKDERAIAYNTAPNQLRASRDSSRYGDVPDKGAYAPCFYVACCPAKSVSNLPEFIRDMVMENDQGDLYLLCYGPAAVNSDAAAFILDTAYPFREKIVIRIERIRPGTVLHLRLPGWCRTPRAFLGDRPVTLAADENGFAAVTGLRDGDVLTLRLPMEVALRTVDDGETTRDYPLCVERGPLVYAIPVPTVWNTYDGPRVCPERDTWPWYEARPDPARLDPWPPWDWRIDPALRPEDVTVTEHETEGYVWEDPPVTLEIPLTRVASAWGNWQFRNYEVWHLQRVSHTPDRVRLVPHGCTNLRITYIPRLDDEIAAPE